MICADDPCVICIVLSLATVEPHQHLFCLYDPKIINDCIWAEYSQSTIGNKNSVCSVLKSPQSAELTCSAGIISTYIVVYLSYSNLSNPIMRRSQSSKHTSLRQAAASSPAVSNATYLTSGSSRSANAQWGVFKVATGVSMSKHQTNKVMDALALKQSELDNLKTADPFMYYSIQSAKAKATRPSLDLSRPEPSNRPSNRPSNSYNERARSNEIRRNTSDSVLMVKRQGRITTERYDMNEMLEELQALRARRTSTISEVSNPNEAKDDDE